MWLLLLRNINGLDDKVLFTAASVALDPMRWELEFQAALMLLLNVVLSGGCRLSCSAASSVTLSWGCLVLTRQQNRQTQTTFLKVAALTDTLGKMVIDAEASTAWFHSKSNKGQISSSHLLVKRLAGVSLGCVFGSKISVYWQTNEFSWNISNHT